MVVEVEVGVDDVWRSGEVVNLVGGGRHTPKPCERRMRIKMRRRSIH